MIVRLPFNSGGADRGLFCAQGDLIRMKVREAELPEQRLFDDLMRDQKPNRW